MDDQLSENSISDLFACVLQHLKCIEIRIEASKSLTSKQQKYILGKALKAAQLAVNEVCSLMPDSKSVLTVKKYLDRADLVYLMLITEEVFRVPPDDVEEVVDMIQTFINNKYK
jgi:hypothetical protein